jgi:hypothetical protein
MSLRLGLILICLCGGAGCLRLSSGSWPEHHAYHRRLDDCAVRHDAVLRAAAAIRRCHRGESCHFRNGFTQAYVDVAQGGDGAVPPVPPERYWKGCRRDARGHEQAMEWFDGYAAGAESACSSPQQPYNTVAASGTYPAGRSHGPDW